MLKQIKKNNRLTMANLTNLMATKSSMLQSDERLQVGFYSFITGLKLSELCSLHDADFVMNIILINLVAFHSSR